MARSISTAGDNITNSALSRNSSLATSFSLWFYLTQNVANGAFGTLAAFGNNFGIYLVGAASSCALHYYYGTVNSLGSTVSLGTWYNVVMTSDGTSCIAWLNGVVEATNFGPPTNQVSTSFATGTDTTADNLPTGTQVADLALWSTGLITQNESKALFAGTRPNRIRPSSLLLWWPLDGLQSPEPDLSGNRSNGTVSGTAKAFGPPINLFTPKPEAEFLFYPPLSILMPQIIL